MNVNGKSCVRIGISLFLLYLCISYWPTFTNLVHSLLQASTPLLLGCVLAYVINILMTFYNQTAHSQHHPPVKNYISKADMYSCNHLQVPYRCCPLK